MASTTRSTVRKPRARNPAPRTRKLKDENRNLRSREQRLKMAVVASVVANLVLVAAVGLMAMGKVEGGKVRIEGLPEPLPAQSFSGQTRETYQIASEIPAVFDATYCYCYCKENHGHRSLLDCYAVDDAHASICDVCQLEALRVNELWDEGMAIQDISDQIDDEFS